MSQQILDLLTIVFPSVFGVGIFSAIVAVVKLAFDLRKARKEMIAIRKDEEYKAQIQALIHTTDELLQENRQLKSTVNELMTMIDHRERK